MTRRIKDRSRSIVAPADDSHATEFWLHIARDGKEHRFSAAPADLLTLHLLTLHVVRENNAELTRTWNIVCTCGKPTCCTRVCPPGVGWKLSDGTRRQWTEWRREVVR
jgi:hypothetical protein